MDAITEEGRMAGPGSDLGKWRPEKFNPLNYAKYKEFCEGQDQAKERKMKFQDPRDRFWWREPLSSWSDIDKNHFDHEEISSCFFTGGAGHNKSTMLKQLKQKFEDKKNGGNVKVLCFTTCATNNLNESSPEEIASTFDSFFFDKAATDGSNLQQRIKRAAMSHRIIMVDEHSQTPKKWINVLAAMQRHNPSLIFLMFGDESQCPPIEIETPRQYKYSRTRVFRELCGYTICRLPYNPATARFGPQLKRAVDKLRDNGTLEMDDSASTFARADIDLDFSICRVNQTKKEVDRRCMTRWANTFTDRKSIVIPAPKSLMERCKWKQKVTLMEGMPVTCRDGNRENSEKLKVDNNDKMKVVSVGDQDIKLEWTSRESKKDANGNRLVVTVKQEHFNQLFDMGFCTTVSRAQGATMDHKYNVFDIHKMTREEMYTAVTRGRKFNQVHIEAAKNKTYRFRRHKYKTSKPAVLELEPQRTALGVVYKISNGHNDKIYIGQTLQQDASTALQAATRRFKQHKNSTKASVDQPMKDLGADGFIVTVIDCQRYFVRMMRMGGSGVTVINTPRRLLKDERDFIRSHADQGVELYNKVGIVTEGVAVIRQAEHIIEVQPVVVHHKKKRCFRVRWTDQDRNERERSFTYAKGKKRKKASQKTKPEAEAQAHDCLAKILAEKAAVPRVVTRVKCETPSQLSHAQATSPMDTSIPCKGPRAKEAEMCHFRASRQQEGKGGVRVVARMDRRSAS
jgi:hypothetical protein